MAAQDSRKRADTQAPGGRAGRPLKTLDRVISKAGLGSRTEARSWIGTGQVTVNGRIIRTPDHWVDLERDHVSISGKPLEVKQKRYILLYKPTGYLTTYKDPQGRKTVYDLLDGIEDWVAPAGRLDLDTSGLLILTNDTDFADRLTNPEHKIPKTYRVRTSSPLRLDEIQRLREGVELKDGPTQGADIAVIKEAASRTVIEITISEGRNRQVRRMIEAVGSSVSKLVRVAIGPLRIGALEIGRWRELTSEEVAALRG